MDEGDGKGRVYDYKIEGPAKRFLDVMYSVTDLSRNIFVLFSRICRLLTM